MHTLVKPRIYVACVAAHEAGFAHGTWIDAALSPDEIREIVDTMIKGSPIAWADKYGIHDCDGFCGINIEAQDDFETVSWLANMITKGDHSPELIRIVYEYLGRGTTSEKVIGFINEFYQGVFKDLGEWAQDRLSKAGELKSIPKNLTSFIDFEGYGRSMQTNAGIFTIEGDSGVHVFNLPF